MVIGGGVRELVKAGFCNTGASCVHNQHLNDHLDISTLHNVGPHVSDSWIISQSVCVSATVCVFFTPSKNEARLYGSLHYSHSPKRAEGCFVSCITDHTLMLDKCCEDNILFGIFICLGILVFFPKLFPKHLTKWAKLLK